MFLSNASTEFKSSPAHHIGFTQMALMSHMSIYWLLRMFFVIIILTWHLLRKIEYIHINFHIQSFSKIYLWKIYFELLCTHMSMCAQVLICSYVRLYSHSCACPLILMVRRSILFFFQITWRISSRFGFILRKDCIQSSVEKWMKRLLTTTWEKEQSCVFNLCCHLCLTPRPCEGARPPWVRSRWNRQS